MSKLYDFREAIKTAVADEDLGLDASDIVIQRQADVFAKITETVAKKDSNGVALTIGAASGDNVDEDADELDMDTRLSVKLWVLPIYNQDAMPEEDIFEPLMKFLHGLVIGDPKVCFMNLKVLRWDDVPDPEYLVREIKLKQRMIF